MDKHYETICEMLSYRRPNRSKTESKYINRFIRPYSDPDSFGNYIVTVGNNPSVMFSSHTDTVHRQGGRQTLYIDDNNKTVFVSDPNSNCLGADDGTGNWLMLEMIKAGKPGLYIFHRGEEVGGLGSTYIARHTPEIVAGIKYAIAFDRMDFADVIDSQSTGKCCSPEFADALAGMLGVMGTQWKPTYGLFTDTANYNHLIPECTNLSVGYKRQHTKDESQSLPFAVSLLEACLALDWESLPVKRDVTDFDDGFQYGYGYGMGYGQGYWGQSYNPGKAHHNAMCKFIRKNVETVADYLIDQKVGVSYLRNYEWLTDGDNNGDSVATMDDVYAADGRLNPDWEWDTDLNCYRNWKTGELVGF